MFLPNSLKALRGMSAKPSTTKSLLTDVNNAIDEIREWKEKEKLDFKKQMTNNQKQQQTLFRSGYEDDGDDIYDEIAQKETELNQRLQAIRNIYRKENINVPSYMSSKSKTDEITMKMALSAERLQNLPQIDLSQIFEQNKNEDVLEKLLQWKNALAELDELSNNEIINHQPLNMENLKLMEQQIHTKEQNQQNMSNVMKAEFEEMEKDFDEIEELMNQCGIK